MRTSGCTLLLAVLGSSGLLLGGCSGGGGWLGGRSAAKGSAGSAADLGGWLRVQGRPFAPASVSIFPLTQLQLDDQGEPWLLLFVELEDRWSDPVKAVGWLTVFLEPAGSVGSSSGGTHEARWDVDLSDASVNSALFDPVTRTYRVQLGGLPPRAVEMARRSELRRQGDASGSDPSGGTRGVQVGGGKLVFRAMFRTLGSHGEELELWDTYELE